MYGMTVRIGGQTGPRPGNWTCEIRAGVTVEAATCDNNENILIVQQKNNTSRNHM